MPFDPQEYLKATDPQKAWQGAKARPAEEAGSTIGSTLAEIPGGVGRGIVSTGFMLEDWNPANQLSSYARQAAGQPEPGDSPLRQWADDDSIGIVEKVTRLGTELGLAYAAGAGAEIGWAGLRIAQRLEPFIGRQWAQIAENVARDTAIGGVSGGLNDPKHPFKGAVEGAASGVGVPVAGGVLTSLGGQSTAAHVVRHLLGGGAVAGATAAGVPYAPLAFGAHGYYGRHGLYGDRGPLAGVLRGVGGAAERASPAVTGTLAGKAAGAMAEEPKPGKVPPPKPTPRPAMPPALSKKKPYYQPSWERNDENQ